jgi:hypothetical protein
MNELERANHEVLVEAIAGEHRLRRQAVREEQEAERWRNRVLFAEERGLSDLAASARLRSRRHRRLAELWRARADELSVEIEELRRSPPLHWSVVRAPPARDPIEAKFDELEIERELEEIRRKLEGRAAPSPIDQPHEEKEETTNGHA